MNTVITEMGVLDNGELLSFDNIQRDFGTIVHEVVSAYSWRKFLKEWDLIPKACKGNGYKLLFYDIVTNTFLLEYKKNSIFSRYKQAYHRNINYAFAL